MKLIIAIVSNDDSSANASLTEHGFMVTRLSTTGGFLRAGNTTMLIGTEDEKVEQAIELIKEESKREQRSFQLPHHSISDNMLLIQWKSMLVEQQFLSWKLTSLLRLNYD